MNLRAWLILGLVVVIVSSLWWTTRSYTPSSLEGKKAPEFSLPNASNQLKTLKDYEGKVVLLNFWATWCGPCVSEMESLEKLSQHFQGKNFTVLAISLDDEGWKSIEQFLKNNPVTFPILLDQEMKIADLYGTYKVPETYLIDAQGNVVEKILGPQDWAREKWISKIDSLISSK